MPPPTYAAPPPSYGASPYGQIPGGYIAYGQVAPAVKAPTGLRTATIVLFWVQSVLTIIFGVVAYNRGEVAVGVRDGDKSVADFNDATDALNSVAFLSVSVAVALIIVLCIWAHHTVRNAKQRDPQLNASPGMAAGGWYIPIGNLWLPWMHLRRAARRFGGALGPLGWWQALSILGGVLLSTGRALANDDDDSVATVIDKGHAQGAVLVVAGLVFVVATIVAMKATRQVDAATSGS